MGSVFGLCLHAPIDRKPCKTPGTPCKACRNGTGTPMALTLVYKIINQCVTAYSKVLLLASTLFACLTSPTPAPILTGLREIWDISSSMILACD